MQSLLFGGEEVSISDAKERWYLQGKIKLARSSRRAPKTCSVCGQSGHYSSWHKTQSQVLEKSCVRCNQTKPISEFSLRFTRRNSGISKDYFHSSCKECERLRSEKRNLRMSLSGRIRQIFSGVRKRAEQYGFEMDLTREYLEFLYEAQNGKCFYTGKEMTSVPGGDCISVERIDSEQGYIRSNVVLIRSKINFMKVDLKFADFLQTCKEIVEFHYGGASQT